MTCVRSRSMRDDFAIPAIFPAGPTRIGSINPLSPASIAPANAVSSHGYTTAVGTASRLLHFSSSRSYLPVPDLGLIPSPLLQLRLAAGPQVPSLSKEK